MKVATLDRRLPGLAIAVVLAAAAAPAVDASDWTNSGGNAGRNGLSAEGAPLQPTPLWSGSRSSIIAWQPVTAGGRVFLVRQNAFVPNNVPKDSPVVCQDLHTGAELWAVDLPYNAGDWTTWVAGTSNGLVYASRAGNGGSIAAKLYALDQATGAVAWASVDTIQTGAYDGVVFADDGDPILAWHQRMMRIDADTGATVWSVPRSASVSGNAGAALFGDALYTADPAVGGQVIQHWDAATGAKLQKGPLMPGFTVQNTPMVGPDGTIYLSRTQNNVATDFFYAFTDAGGLIDLKWSVPAAWSTSSEFGVGPDGSVYMLAPGNLLARLHPDTGATLDLSPFPLASGSIAPRLAIDRDGRVIAGNGGFAGGKVYCFERDLAPRWQVAVTNVNIGAPCLGEDGVLVVAGVGTDVRAFRAPNGFTDVGFALAGSTGEPRLEGTSTLLPGDPVTLALTAARPDSSVYFLASATGLFAPFKGGTLVPAPDVVLGGLPSGPLGELALTGSWPPGLPAGTGIWFQEWIVDPAAPSGVAASNGVKALTP